MGFVADIFKTIATAISEIFKGVQAVVEWIGTKILPVLAAIGTTVLLGLGVISLFAPAVAAAASAAIAGVVTSMGSIAINIITLDFAGVVAGIQGMTAGFGAFLAAIHFKTILAIHSIAMIFSKGYRELINSLYKSISEVSDALFGDTMTLHLIFQNTRTLFMSAASLIGYQFDLAQISWLQRFDEILVQFNEKAGDYKDNPELLFQDLDEWSNKYSQDIAGGSQQVILSTLDTVITAVNTTVEKVVAVNSALYEMELALPENVRKYVIPITGPIHERIDSFYYDEYKPKVDQLNKALDDNVRQTREHRAEVSTLVLRLKNPLDYLREIELQPGRIRIDAESGLEELSSRPFRESADQAEIHDLVEEEEYTSALEELKASTPPPSVLTYEPVGPTIVALSKSARRTSPFVGDY